MQERGTDARTAMGRIDRDEAEMGVAAPGDQREDDHADGAVTFPRHVDAARWLVLHDREHR